MMEAVRKGKAKGDISTIIGYVSLVAAALFLLLVLLLCVSCCVISPNHVVAAEVIQATPAPITDIALMPQVCLSFLPSVPFLLCLYMLSDCRVSRVVSRSRSQSQSAHVSPRERSQSASHRPAAVAPIRQPRVASAAPRTTSSGGGAASHSATTASCSCVWRHASVCARAHRRGTQRCGTCLRFVVAFLDGDRLPEVVWSRLGQTRAPAEHTESARSLPALRALQPQSSNRAQCGGEPLRRVC